MPGGRRKVLNDSKMVHGHGTRSSRRRRAQEEEEEVIEQDQQQQVVTVEQDLLQHPVVVTTADGQQVQVDMGDHAAGDASGAAGADLTTHLVVHDASGNPVLVQAHPVVQQQEEVVVSTGEAQQQDGQVTVLTVADASAAEEAMVGIVAGLEEAADRLLEQEKEKHLEAAMATHNLLEEEPTLKKDGPGISDIIVRQHREKEKIK